MIQKQTLPKLFEPRQFVDLTEEAGGVPASITVDELVFQYRGLLGTNQLISGELDNLIQETSIVRFSPFSFAREDNNKSDRPRDTRYPGRRPMIELINTLLNGEEV